MIQWSKVKKLSVGTIILLGLALFWLPLGMPDDFITVPAIIHYVGFQTFVIVSILLVALIYWNKEVRGVLKW